jgi:predicted alpha/beta-hydrolase family hydrolase
VKTERSKLTVLDGRYQVSTILMTPDNPKAVMVLGHGAGAGMEHQFMSQLADNLATFGIASLRYNFPYMEQGRRTPTSPAISQATIKAAVDEAHQLFPAHLLLVGGKSYGGRMSSQAQSNQLLTGVSGLIFYGFPLHAPGKPGDQRGEHLKNIKIPMLFVQGSRDKLANLAYLRPLVENLGHQATMEVIEGADHGFNMLKSASKTSTEVQLELAKMTAKWATNILIH